MSGDNVPRRIVSGEVLAPNPWDYRSNQHAEIACWQPPLVSADVEMQPGLHVNRARSRELVHTNAFASNALETLRDGVIGRSFDLALIPDYDVLGVSADEADTWAQFAEGEWRRYASSYHFDVDASRKSTWTFLMHQVMAGVHVDGEVLGIVRAKEGPLGYQTCLQMIEPERLDDRNNQVDTNLVEIRYGVERDEYGEPIAYHIRKSHPSDARWNLPRTGDDTVRIERYGLNYRPQVLHVFDEDRPGMTRGVSRAMITSLRQIKMLQSYNDAELAKQIQAASFAAVIESELDYTKAMGLLGDQMESYGNNITTAAVSHLKSIAPYHKETGLNYGGARVVHLVPGEQLKLVQSAVSGMQMEPFERAFLRQIAAGLNVSYEDLSRDYSDLSYSAARQSLTQVWRRYLRMRTMLVQKFAMPFVAAWMEEAIMTKRLPMLGRFKANDQGWRNARHALVRGDFISWDRPIIDPVKEYTGKGIAMAYGLTTLRDEAAAEGSDWTSNLRQREREMRERERLGLNQGGADPTLTIGGQVTDMPDATADAGSGGGNRKAGNTQEQRRARSDGRG
jgi:lambda family phage portal protein